MRGDLDDADKDLVRAINLQNAAIKAAPDEGTYRYFLGNHWINVGQLREEQNRTTDAAAAYAKAAKSYSEAGHDELSAKYERLAAELLGKQTEVLVPKEAKESRVSFLKIEHRSAVTNLLIELTERMWLHTGLVQQKVVQAVVFII